MVPMASTKTHHADALIHMAYAIRMLLITDKNTAHVLSRAYMNFHPKKAPNKEEEPIPEQARGLEVMRREAWKMVTRIWLYCFLERILMFELQGTLFAMSRALNPNGPWWWRSNLQITLSLAISLVTLTKAIFDHTRQGLPFERYWSKVPKTPGKNEKFTEFIRDRNAYRAVYRRIWLGSRGGYWIGLVWVYA